MLEQETLLTDDVLIDTVKASKLLGIPAATLAKWRSTRETEIPFIKIGRAVKYRTTDLLEFVEKNTQ